MEKAFAIFREYLARNNMKLTRQREVILQAFMASDGHISAEDLYRLVSMEDSSIGLATVYRTLNLLVECGLAQRRQFGEGERRYEHVLERGHHDHLVCARCGSIAEFFNPEVDRILREVSQEQKFRLLSHRLELYGLCSTCQG